MGQKSQDQEKVRKLTQQCAEKGWNALQQSDFAQAERHYARAVANAQKLNDPNLTALYLSHLALSKQNQGKLEQAKIDLEICLSLAREYTLPAIEAHAQVLLGSQSRQNGEIDRATHHFLCALECSLNSKDAVSAEMSFGNLGLIYLERGLAEQALECFRQAVEISAYSPNHAAWLGSLGQALSELAQYDQAITHFNQAYARAQQSGDVQAQSICKGSLGNALFEQGKFDPAIDCYMQALELSNSISDLARAGIWSGNLGNAYRRLGRNQESMKYCQSALELARSTHDKHAEAAHLDSIGDCYLSAGNLQKALTSYEQALQISLTIHDLPGQRIYLSNIGRTHQRLGQFEPAFDFLSRAIDMFDEQRASIRSDDLKTSFATRGQDLYADMVRLCLDRGRRVEAIEYVGRAKSRAILDLLANSPIDVAELSAVDDDSLRRLVEREGQLRSQITRLEKLFWDGPTKGTGTRSAPASKEQAQQIYAEWRDVMDRLKRRHPQYASLIAVDTLNFEQIKNLWSTSPQTALDQSTAVLEYYWTDQYFLAMSFWSGCEQPQVLLITDAEALVNLKLELAEFLEMSATEGWTVPRGLCVRLYNQLMAPVLTDVPDHVRRLIIIPHGSLYRLPFCALHNGKHYLIERFALSYLPTVSLIPIMARLRHKEFQASYLVSAISDYSATRKHGISFSSRLRSAAGLDDLGYTMEEANTLLELGNQQKVATKLLTNEQVKQSLPEFFGQYPVVHFAGHAIFNQQEPMASGLVLSDGSILSAASILQGNVLRTKCGKLLVLSACQTGVNAISAGGEILGLARALMYAGMPNLILSLWEVVDRSTALLMQEFHQNWQAGRLSIAEALQQAQISAIKNGQAIHTWAPFIHLGIE